MCSGDSKRIPSHTEILLTSVQAMHVDMKETQMENVALHFLGDHEENKMHTKLKRPAFFFADVNIRCMREDVQVLIYPL